MRLFIAEKPAMGRDIAKFLPGPHVKQQGYIKAGNDCVTWCIGHILEQTAPEDYDAKYKNWNLQDLPIVPDVWKKQVAGDKSPQVKIIKELLKQCTEVINAGDPGREGQLIVDEVLEYLGNKKPVKRILLKALNEPTVRQALANLEDNRKFEHLYHAALGRERADWIIGMNQTRLYSMLLQSQHQQRQLLSVGRVQTPTLAIVVRRDLEIENFKPSDYWTLQATASPSGKSPFVVHWVPPGQDPKHATQESTKEVDPVEVEDDESIETSGKVALPAWVVAPNRILDRGQAETIAQALRQAGQAHVTRYDTTPAKENAPLLLDLAGMQQLMDQRMGASAQQTLEACQSLYEKGHTSYPRTDSCYLPSNMHVEAPSVFQAMAKAFPDLAPLIQQADASLVSRVFNDDKTGEHYAIIPTSTPADVSSLSPLEKAVYLAASKQYLAQFFPACEVNKTLVAVEAAQHTLVARGRVVVSPGWRVVFSKQESEHDEQDVPLLPMLSVGEMVGLGQVQLQAKQTKPPPHFTEGTLLKAMQHVDRLVKDPEEKKKLKAVEGIGRSATRAGIMETLLRRKFMRKEGRKLKSTEMGRYLVQIVPAELTSPGLTAQWETFLDGVASGKVTLEAFMAKQVAFAAHLVGKGKQSVLPPPPAVEATPAKGSSSRSGGTSKSGGKSSYGSSGGKSSTGASSKPKSSNSASPSAGNIAGEGQACPACGKGTMRAREVKQGPSAGKKFLGCSNYPACKHSIWP